MQPRQSINYKEPILLIKKLQDGSLAVIDAYTTIRFIDPKTFKTIEGFKAKIPHKRNKANRLAIGSDKKFFGSIVANDRETRLYSITSKKAVAKVSRHQGEVSCIGMDPKDRYLFSCGDDGKTFAVDVKNARLAFTLPIHPDTVNDIAFNKTGQWVATCSFDRTVSVFSIDMMQRTAKLAGHSKPVMKICFVGKNRLVSIDKASSTVVWNLIDGSVITRLSGIHDEPTVVVGDEEGKFLFVATQLGYVIVFDLERYELVTQKYIKVGASITSMFFDIQTHTLYLGTSDGDVFGYYIYEGLDEIKTLVQERNFEAVQHRIETNPILKNTEIFHVLETIWEKTLEKARRLLEVGRKDEAKSLLAPYTKIPSKAAVIQNTLKDSEHFANFKKHIQEGKFSLAYSLAEKYPTFKDSQLYKRLEEDWRQRMKKAQKLAMNPKTLDEAKELLQPFRNVSDKSKAIQELFVKSDVYNRFKMTLASKDFKAACNYFAKHPFLKNFPEYHLMLNYAEELLQSAKVYMQKNLLVEAMRDLQILRNFNAYESKANELIGDIQTRHAFFDAVKEKNISKAYEFLAKNEELSLTPEGKKLEKLWLSTAQKANKYAAKGDIDSLRKVVKPFFEIPSKYTALASIFAYAYMMQLERALKESYKRQSIEAGIKKYVSMFGLTQEIENFIELFKKEYEDTKINPERLNSGSSSMWRPTMIVDSIFQE